MGSDEAELIERIRDAVPARRRGVATGKSSYHTPAWRINKEIEARALSRAFTRHGCKTDEQKSALVEKMRLELDAQSRYRRTLSEAREFVPQPRQLSVWLNQDGWLDEFETATSELKNRTRTFDAACEHQPCNEPVIGRTDNGGWICEPHYLRASAAIEDLRVRCRLQLKQMPRLSGEMWREWYQRYMAEHHPSMHRMLRERWAQPAKEVEACHGDQLQF